MVTTKSRRLQGCCDTACPDNSSAAGAPTISIGLPVYNGENFLVQAIESVLAQTFQDYELIISDNASTDATAAICRDYAQKSDRVCYHRSPINKGPAWNYNRVFHLARGKYFKWAAHDDVFEPTFLEKTLAKLEQNPAAVLSFSQVDIIDHASKLIRPYSVEMSLDARHPARRFQETTSLKHRCYEIFGLIRTGILAKTPLIGAYAGSDRVLLSQLILQGPFEVVPEPLFKAREHAEQSIAMLRKPRHKHLRMHDYAIWFDPKNRGKILLPNWRILYEYVVAISAVSMSFTERAACWLVLVRWGFSYSNFAKLGRDLAIASVKIISRLYPWQVRSPIRKAPIAKNPPPRSLSRETARKDLPSKVRSGSLKR